MVEIRSSTATGSGVVYDRAGHIVTNAHVVGPDRSVQVLAAQTVGPLTGTVVGTFTPNDLAVVKIDPPRGLRPASWANSAELAVGTPVLAMGNPLGVSGTVTDGIVSATGRTVTVPANGTSPELTLPDMIQTSAAVSPGNSGGALVALDGSVVGVPTATVATEGGPAAGVTGFAIPADDVLALADQIIETGTVTRPGRASIGAEVTTVLDPTTGRPRGLGVVAVDPGGPADQSGLRPGDIVVSVDGTGTLTTGEFGDVLATLPVGEPVTVTIRRGAERQDLTLRPVELPG
ncbi:S1C family serine protease [Modestobacter altitudinis]|uniref:S1C family serine protease n=1 Tax=Modestobacter altitudinis TaxID=2213158 RepID=UPI0014860ACD|nr:trypsin-like peptidase domain-containing protein [Modestobacter altitudinis]